TNVNTVKHIVQARIANEDTEKILERVLDLSGGTSAIGDWDNRLTIDVKRNPNEFYAILGSPNGSGGAYFLLTHKAKLGIRTIDTVDIFKGLDDDIILWFPVTIPTPAL
ncbi:hypothetical protein QQX98_003200, partial [Neonectria punicea]